MIWEQFNLKRCYRLLLRFKRIFLVLLLSLFILYFLRSPELEQRTYFIKNSPEDIPLYLEIASKSSEIRKGLSGRDYLSKQSGMLFVFKKHKILRFWMKDTKISLDLLYLDHNLVVQEIHTNLIPYSEEVISSESPYSYALELNAGFVDYHNIKIGDQIYAKK